MTEGISICRNCGYRIVRLQFSDGSSWRHQPAGSAFQDNMTLFCETTVAEPAEE